MTIDSQGSILDQLTDASQPGKVARQWLERGQARLNAAFQQRNIRELVHARAALVDDVLTATWQLLALHQDSDCALVAVGGYGRGELHPCSDVDLMILTANKPEAVVCGKIERFITLLWDIGLEIGHSVRTLDECVALAADDITIATNIMEARTLFGDDQLRISLAERTGAEQMWSSEEFFAAKWQEQTERHGKFNFTEYSLEPDLKNAPGGLRDLQTIAWVAKRHFNADSLDDLLEVGFLTEQEHAILNRCQDYLWELRWQLHLITGRNENRLLFDYQRQVAERLGHQDNEANLAVEYCMKQYYRVAMAISVMNELLLQLFDELILQQGQTESITPINRRFQIHNGYLELTGEQIVKQYPSSLIEAFVILAQNPDIKGIRASTVRLFIHHRKLIDATFRNDLRHTTLFMALLRSPHALFTQLRRMKRYGILGQYLPEFGRIIGMMQYDLFHIYTVDFHTLTVVKHMRQMRYDDAREKLPLAHEVFYRLPKPELLYIAGLYHDIAKGRGGDHSSLGADDAIAFCQRHGLSSWDAKLVAWLVQHHLLMSVTAQRKDTSDPQVVHEFARQVGDLVHLDYLYTLTVADINATNPKLWNSWRAQLLRHLYRETRRALRRGLNNPVEKQDWIDETRDTALHLLTQQGIHRAAIEALWSGIGDEYFLRENAADIAWHTEAMLDRADRTAPLVLLRESSGIQFEGGTQIFIYTPDTDNLFATTTSALDQLNLTIVDARIITSADGFTLDTYIVLDEQGTPISNDAARIAAIRDSLTESLRDPERFSDILQRRMPRRHRHFQVPTQIIISNDIVHDHTIVDVQALDRPGLLARIGQLFAQFNLRVQNARIATLGERVEDVFFVTDQHGQPLSDPALCERLQQEMKAELDGNKEIGAA